eukprot:9491972-Pyramimonas_sp.AAC.1
MLDRSPHGKHPMQPFIILPGGALDEQLRAEAHGAWVHSRACVKQSKQLTKTQCNFPACHNSWGDRAIAGRMWRRTQCNADALHGARAFIPSSPPPCDTVEVARGLAGATLQGSFRTQGH